MRKLLIAALASGLLSTVASAGWVVGKITSVNVYATCTSVGINDGSTTYLRCIDPALDAEITKQLITVSLTAKSLVDTVKLSNNCASGAGYWCAIAY